MSAYGEDISSVCHTPGTRACRFCAASLWTSRPPGFEAREHATPPPIIAESILDDSTPIAMKIAVPKEITPGERRVALVPDAVAGLVKAGLQVLVERGARRRRVLRRRRLRAGRRARRADAATLYARGRRRAEGAEADARRGRTACARARCWSRCCRRSRARTWSSGSPPGAITAFGMEGVPRISRAQKMDALSSQANIAGYKAGLHRRRGARRSSSRC